MEKINTLKSLKSKSLNGIIKVSGDKSISHRSLMFASLCFGNSKIYGLLESDDVLNTLNCIRKLGIKVLKRKKYFEVFGTGGFFISPKTKLNFGNSGTGVRLMMGLLITKNIFVNLEGDSSLHKRPMDRIIDPLKKLGAKIEHENGFLPIKIKKSKFLYCHDFIEKLGSAQVKSAIILAALDIKGKTRIYEKKPSRNHSEILLKYLGAKIYVEKEKAKKYIIIEGPTVLNAKNIRIPGDFSSAAFLIVACLICKDSKLTIKSVGINHFRTGLLEILNKMGAKIKLTNEQNINGEKIADIHIRSSNLKAISLDDKISPRMIDEYPILFVAAAFAIGTSKFTKLKELKFKESDRLTCMATALKKCGVDLKLSSESIQIKGGIRQKGGVRVRTHKDHRIAMSMIIFGLRSDKFVEVDDIEMIKTSFPDFIKILKNTGANLK